LRGCQNKGGGGNDDEVYNIVEPTAGKLTINGLTKHEGKSIYATANSGDLFLTAAASITPTDIISQKIVNGSVTLQVWQTFPPSFLHKKNYKGNDTVSFTIFTEDDKDLDGTQNGLPVIHSVSVTFTNGKGSGTYSPGP